MRVKLELFYSEFHYLFDWLGIRIAGGLGDRRGVVGDRVDRTRDRWALFELILNAKKNKHVIKHGTKENTSYIIKQCCRGGPF